MAGTTVMGVSRHVFFYYLFFNNSLLYCTIHCQLNISESESETGSSSNRPELASLNNRFLVTALCFSNKVLK